MKIILYEGSSLLHMSVLSCADRVCGNKIAVGTYTNQTRLSSVRHGYNVDAGVCIDAFKLTLEQNQSKWDP